MRSGVRALSNHRDSVEPRERRRTHKTRESVRRDSGYFRRLYPQAWESAREMYVRLTDPRPDRLTGFPGVPSRSRIVHRRTDEPNELSALLSLFIAKAALGEPRTDLDCTQLWLGEWGDRLHGDAPALPLDRSIYFTQGIVSDLAVAKARCLFESMSTPSIKFLREKCRAAIAALRTLLRGINHELASRGVA